MDGHHNLHWYEYEVARFASIVREKFGVELDDREKKSIRDEMYRAVNDAKVRAASLAPV